MESDNRSFLSRVVENKWVCMITLIVGFVYMVSYSFFVHGDPMHWTASMIGRSVPRLFVFWGVISSLALVLNLNYMYHRGGYKGVLVKIGTACQYVGTLFIMMCVLIPSIEKEEVVSPLTRLQIVGHWSGALLFGVFFAASIIIYLISARKDYKGMTVALILFSAMLATLIALLIAFNKNGVIELIPMAAAEILVFLINFTGLFKKKTA